MPFLQHLLAQLSPKKAFHRQGHGVLLSYLLRWVFISLLVGGVSGSASALFLVLLEFVTQYRETHAWVLYLLPVAGFLIGAAYQYGGKGSEGGNNLLLQTIQKPSLARIPFVMAPLVMLATVLTHLVGGSAGREGTAVQMGGSLADQLTPWLKLRPRDRQVLLICGVSGGFASVFGTPLAGAVFGLEVFLIGQLRYHALLPSFLTACFAHWVTLSWGVGHTVYPEVVPPAFTVLSLGATLLAGICFGVVARGFAGASHAVAAIFKTTIAYRPLRPAIGGVLLLLVLWALGTTNYVGLGIPTIVASFETPLPGYDFALKLFLTALTLGCGFKGGEVTPLFFIGATLGNALFPWLPLPLEMLAALGFVAVFAGAANTPLACTFMAVELFGSGCGMYAGLACVVAYLFSGHKGIYGGQVVGSSKHLLWGRDTGKALEEL
ncbi:voltage-gated chloride channel family protein [Rufibacter quisquiliarum]|uniref:H+/Cl- antiporter ClcA n=1 Tax=Rufibacter quisquiliarum TaxID=1549639 RepID=A0A839GQX6_9BACT|nr:voltage-gated chloride channel family protein [Rufibacter quisquiliarum]MBA9077297.1 H+/Cl- antiporter ClcA [Rufibacter quisquiliarum]